MNRKGIFYIIAAPSGAGKTSLVKALAEETNDIKISISYTTRPVRQGEIDGVNYNFVSEEQFQDMVDRKQFLEHAEVYGYLYGTSHDWVLRQLTKGVDVLLEIDWQGARQVCQQFPDAVSIFIIPPSYQTLSERLENRAQDDPEVIASRMTAAKDELIHCHEFDYLVVNDKFDAALRDMKHIVKSQRLRYADQEQTLKGLLAELLETQ